MPWPWGVALDGAGLWLLVAAAGALAVLAWWRGRGRMGEVDRYRNADGTYDGVQMLAALSGLSEAEIAWTAERLVHLMREGKPKAEAVAIVREEAQARPWEVRHA